MGIECHFMTINYVFCEICGIDEMHHKWTQKISYFDILEILWFCCPCQYNILRGTILVAISYLLKSFVVIIAEDPAQTSRPVLLTMRGTSSLTGIICIFTVAGTLVLVLVLATSVNLSLSVSAPLWKYWK